MDCPILARLAFLTQLSHSGTDDEPTWQSCARDGTLRGE
jgi:hypothetical protein